MLSLRFILVCLVASAFGSAGCSGPTYVTIDASTDGSAPMPEATLVLVSSPSLAIRPGEVGAIEVRCVGPSGAPLLGVPVSFAIEGAALDSTLTMIAAETGEDGRAAGGIVAGNSATTFRVRIASHAAVRPVYVDVGVGTSFGTLVVHAPYEGSRAVTQRLVDVVPSESCASLLASPPAVGSRALPDGQDEISIAGLPTTVRYAVLARAVTALATTAAGCVDDVVLDVDETTRLEVAYVDTPLGIDGRYDAVLTLEASVAAGLALEVVERSIDAASAARGGDAVVLLDTIGTQLAERSPALGEAFSTARVADSLDETLADRLATDANGPTDVTIAWVREARTALAYPYIQATLTFAVPGASVIRTDTVSVPDREGGTIALTPTSLDPDLGMSRAFTVRIDGAGDAVELDPIVLDVPLGRLAVAWIDRAAPSELDGATKPLRAACDAVRAFVADTPATAACDESCVDAVCDAMAATSLADLRAAAELVDGSIGALSLTGSLTATDADGDARVDALEGSMSGAYLEASGSSIGPVTGAMSVSRIPLP